MDSQMYTILGIATAGLIVNELLNYQHRQRINCYIGRIQELTKQAQEINVRLNSGFSKLFKSIEDKLK